MTATNDMPLIAPIAAALILIFAVAHSGNAVRDTPKMGAVLGIDGAVLTSAR